MRERDKNLEDGYGKRRRDKEGGKWESIQQMNFTCRSWIMTIILVSKSGNNQVNHLHCICQSIELEVDHTLLDSRISKLIIQRNPCGCQKRSREIPAGVKKDQEKFRVM
jgi:hypothetical protein